MIRDDLARALAEAVAAAAPALGLDPADLPAWDLTRPRQKEHGDWTTNLGLALAPKAGRTPRSVAEAVVEHLRAGGPGRDLIASVEVAGPGFINIHLKGAWLHDVLRAILERGPAYGSREESRGLRVQVEFVSANPTGPLHVGTARNAVIGDALANVLAADGWDVEREYYWNDTGTQMENLGASIEARYLQRLGVDAPFPESGYQGAYVGDLAEEIAAEAGERWIRADPEERRRFFLDEGRRRMIANVRSTLERFGVSFDTWFSEGSLGPSGAIDAAVARLRQAGHVYEAEGATFFRATAFGDDKDRVLIRSNGEPTYFAKDVAYLIDKFGRDFDRLVYVWGADHHGAVARLRGAAQALGYDPSSVDFVVYQLVSLYRGGEPVRMSKRTGDVVTLDELLDEVGPDAARYTLAARSSDSPIDFDIEVVTRQSMDNPVFYVQYAHARIASVLRVAAERGVELRSWTPATFEELTEEAELDLLRKLAELPEVVEQAAELSAPNRIARFAEEAATAFHRFYTECRVISEDDARTQARLWLSAGAKRALANALGLLGVSAPESMERLGGDGDSAPDAGDGPSTPAADPGGD